MSKDMKTPKTPVTKNMNRAKNSLTRNFNSQELRTPQKATIPVNSTMGTLIPSTPIR